MTRKRLVGNRGLAMSVMPTRSDLDSTISLSSPGYRTGGTFAEGIDALLLGRKKEGREPLLCVLFLSCLLLKITGRSL